MNLEYLQETHTFHVERIMDFLAHNLPLCAIHQTRTIIFFCYLFAGLIEFLLYPPYSVGNTPFTLTTLFLPLIIVVVLHIILTICYIFGALFERASCITGLGLMFFFHAPIPIVIAVGGIIISTTGISDYYLSFSIIVAVAVFIDFLCGIVSRHSQVIILSFEIIAVVPAAILTALYFQKTVTQIWVPFLPPFIYFFLYFVVLLFLCPFCGFLRSCTLALLSDPEIGVEFIAAVDPQLKPFKTRADWVDEPDALGSDHAGIGGGLGGQRLRSSNGIMMMNNNNNNRSNNMNNNGNMNMNNNLNMINNGGNTIDNSARTSRWSSRTTADGIGGGIGGSGGIGIIGSGGGIGGSGGIGGGGGADSAITRFPSRADFQLYNVDATPERPLYLASPLPMLALAVLLAVVLVHCMSPLSNFYFWLAGGALLVVLAVLLNSRATACSFLAFTNLDDKCVDILWDHPGLSLL